MAIRGNILHVVSGTNMHSAAGVPDPLGESAPPEGPDCLAGCGGKKEATGE